MPKPDDDIIRNNDDLRRALEKEGLPNIPIYELPDMNIEQFGEEMRRILKRIKVTDEKKINSISDIQPSDLIDTKEVLDFNSGGGVCASSASTEVFSLDELIQKRKTLQAARMDSFKAAFVGVKIFVDPTGTIAGDNEYVIMCGPSFYKELKNAI